MKILTAILFSIGMSGSLTFAQVRDSSIAADTGDLKPVSTVRMDRTRLRSIYDGCMKVHKDIKICQKVTSDSCKNSANPSECATLSAY